METISKLCFCLANLATYLLIPVFIIGVIAWAKLLKQK